MEKFSHFIGIDVSKMTIDVSCLKDDQVLFTGKCDNTGPQIKKLLRQLKSLPGFSLQTALFCMENTGMYSLKTALFLFAANVEHVWIEAPMQILYSQGVTRGKSDKTDALKIAYYAQTFHLKMRKFCFEKSIVKLNSLVNLRTIILSCTHKFTVSKLEYDQVAAFLDLKDRNKIMMQCLKHFQNCLKQVDDLLLQTVMNDPLISKRFKQINSIPGVGKITAFYVIIATGNFTRITDPRKFACYSGVAPFDHSSGTSLKGRSRVSDHANKVVKKTLHLAAMSAIQIEGELKNYYHRKVDAGKNKMSVLNAVRNKLIHRIFACVNQDKMYVFRAA